MTPVAVAEIAIVWPDKVNGMPPGVRVVLPSARLVGFPVKTIPSIVYVSGDPVRVPVPIPSETPVAAIILGEGKGVAVPSTFICPPVALAGNAIV